MSASLVPQPVADILLKLVYEPAYTDHDIRVFLALDAGGVCIAWTPVNQRKLSQVISSGGRPASRRTVMESLKRLTAGGILQKEGRKYRVMFPQPSQPHRTRG